MTIEKQPPGLWFVFCDEAGCDTKVELDTDPDDGFLHALKEIKDLGWMISFEGRDWMHICPDCKEIRVEEAAKDLGFKS